MPTAKKKARKRKPKLTTEQQGMSKTSQYSGAMVDVLLMSNYKRDGVLHLAGQTIKMHSDELAEKPWLCEVGLEREIAFQEFTETLGAKGSDRRVDAPGKG